MCTFLQQGLKRPLLHHASRLYPFVSFPASNHGDVISSQVGLKVKLDEQSVFLIQRDGSSPSAPTPPAVMVCGRQGVQSRWKEIHPNHAVNAG